MDRAELRRILDEEGIRRDVYSLDGGLQNDTMCIEEVYGQWFFYYTERGIRSGERKFATEDEACRYLLERLRNDSSAHS